MSKIPTGIWVSIVAVWALISACPLSAEENQAEFGPASAPKKLVSPPRLLDTTSVGPVFELVPADKTLTHSIEAWNRAGNHPRRNGIERSVPQALPIVLEKTSPGEDFRRFKGGVLARSSRGDATVWGISIRTEKAWRTRIRLGDVQLPEGTHMWVYGEGAEAVGPFGTELKSPDGTLWTPSIGGPEIRFEVSVPDAAWNDQYPPSLRIEAVAEIFRLNDKGVPQLGEEFQLKDTSCLIDAACVGTGDWAPMDFVPRAVAHLQFMDGGSGYICTGTLVNDKDQSTWVPYLLTARHCFSSQAAASTLDAFFDYIQSPCGGSAPSLGSLPRSSGSTLLATSSTNDFTFVRLNSLPGGRSLLGWTTTEPTNGESLYRVHHPQGLPASYTDYSKVSNPPGDTCGLSTSNFHFVEFENGGSFGGSSGSSLLNESGQIVGQLGGGCGPNPSDGCDYSNLDYDGKFSKTFPLVSPYINVEGGGGNPCVQDLDDGVVCLRSGRFEFVGTWTDFANPAKTQPLIWTPVENINATAGFQNNPSGIQIVMRVADGCGLTGTWWVWLGGFTDAGWNISVRDTVTGKQRTFTKARQGGVFPTTTRDSTTFTCN